MLFFYISEHFKDVWSRPDCSWGPDVCRAFVDRRPGGGAAWVPPGPGFGPPGGRGLWVSG